jgi:hypothetical protein
MSRVFGLAILAWSMFVGSLFCAAARGEVFELRGGGRVTGRLVNPDELPRKTYVIETLSGGQVTLAADDVVKRTALGPRETEYEKLRAECPDTVDGHWRLAEWCRENFLTARREEHLRRILQLDPNHKDARAVLGYIPVDGSWKLRREVNESRGLKWYRGRWRTKQEVEVIQRKEDRTKGRQKWYGLLKRYRTWLDDARAEQGRQAIMAINDPAAVAALDYYLSKEELREVKTLYIEVLSRLNTPEAVKALTDCSLEDNDEEVRLRCLDHLKEEKRPEVVADFIQSLKAKDNVILNRAAVGLSYMKDRSAIEPLINALVTTHRYRQGQGNPGQIGAGFSQGSAGLNVGSQPKWARVTHQNQAVLDALTSLTGGVNFGFDVEAWRFWYAQQNKRGPVDTRRD